MALDAPALEDPALGPGGGLLRSAITHADIVHLLSLQVPGDARVFCRVSGFTEATGDSVVFALDQRAFEQASQSRAGLILAPLGKAFDQPSRVLNVADPKYAFALISRSMGGATEVGVHTSAVVEGALGEGTSVGAGSIIEPGARIGKRCTIAANVTIYGCVTLGDHCVVQAGAVLGAMGFGYVRGPDGRHVRFPQIGTLRVGDHVEIGANTTIDRGALGETVIGRGTKIDNLVHIAHNCIVGEDVLIAAQVGMAGSCVIEDGVMLGGQVGLGERVTVGKGVILGGQGGVLPGKRLDGAGQVFWGTPARPAREYLRDVARMRRR